MILLIISIILTILFIILIINSKDSFIENSNSIPKVIYITHKNKLPNYVIDNWKKLNPEYKIIYYNDEDIRKFLKNNYPKSYLDYFNFLDNNKGAGPIKSDFWRLCILNKYGGVYVDADIEPIEPIITFLEKDTDLLLCCTDAPRINEPNPHILISKPNDPIIKLCLDIYERENFNKKYDYWSHSITKVMNKVLREMFDEYNNHIEKNYYKNNYKVQMLLEKAKGNKIKDIYCVYKGKRVLNNRYKSYNSSKHSY